MRLLFSIFIAAISAAFTLAPASAHEYTVGTLFVHHPAVNATPPSANTAAGYFEIKNNGDDADELIAIDAPTLASKAEIHSMTMNNGVMEMRTLSSLTIPAEQEVAMSPEGTHIMFTGLKAPIKEGQKFPATLHFKNAGNVDVYFAAAPIGTMPGGAQVEDHMDMSVHTDMGDHDHAR
jgi:copper(I)-binding protein